MGEGEGSRCGPGQDRTGQDELDSSVGGGAWIGLDWGIFATCVLHA